MKILVGDKIYKSVLELIEEDKREQQRRESIDNAYAVLCFCMVGNEYHHKHCKRY